MLKRLPIILFVLAQTFVFAVSPVSAKKPKYVEESVSDGGTISGAIIFKGRAPDPVKVDLAAGKNPEFCLEHANPNKEGELLIQHVEVDKGFLKDAVVFIEYLEKGKPWSKGAVKVDFKNCQPYPKIAVIRKPLKFEDSGLLTIENHDEGVLHNPKGYSIRAATRKTWFKKFLLNKGSKVDVTKTLRHLRKGRDSHFYIECEQHLWMSISSRIVWNPYYDISNTDGSFRLGQVPPGTYKVVVWHPYVGEKSVEVKVSTGQTAQIEVSLP